MYDNILHKPLAMRPGASSTAWSLLQGLLEKDGTHRLGSSDDFVSRIIALVLSIYRHYMCSSISNFSAPSGGQSIYTIHLLIHNKFMALVIFFFLKNFLLIQNDVYVDIYSSFSEWDQSSRLLFLHQLAWPWTKEDPSPIQTQSGKYFVSCTVIKIWSYFDYSWL